VSEKALGPGDFIVGLAMATGGAGAGVVEVVVPAMFMFPDAAVAVCS
jgi:hypothetical protein